MVLSLPLLGPPLLGSVQGTAKFYLYKEYVGDSLNCRNQEFLMIHSDCSQISKESVCLVDMNDFRLLFLLQGIKSLIIKMLNELLEK